MFMLRSDTERSVMFGIRSGIAGGRSGGPDVGSGGSSAVFGTDIG